MSEFFTSSFENKSEELAFLKSLGFNTNPLNKTVKSVQEAYEYGQEIQKNRENLNYFIDGLVVKIEDNLLAQKLGIVGKTPRAWCAIKFAPDELSTKILDIIWQVGRTGKLTPVAVLEPVNIDNTEVTRATLHNAKEVLDSKIFKNDTVIVRKAGDIIPEIVMILPNLRVSNEVFSLPTFCPSCGEKLVWTDTKVDLFCKNGDFCQEQIKYRLAYYCSRNIANINGLSEKTISKLMENFGFKDIFDIYQIPYEAVENLPNFGKKAVQNIQKSVDGAREIEDYKFLAGLGIDGVGVEVSKIICNLLD